MQMNNQGPAWEIMVQPEGIRVHPDQFSREAAGAAVIEFGHRAEATASGAVFEFGVANC